VAVASCAWAGWGAGALAGAALGLGVLVPQTPLPAWGRVWALVGWVGLLAAAVLLGVPALGATGALALALVAGQLEVHASLAARVDRVDSTVSRRVVARALVTGALAWGAGAVGTVFPRSAGFWGSLGWMALALLALGVLARLVFKPADGDGAR